MKKRSVISWLAVSLVGLVPAPATATANDDTAPSGLSAVKIVSFTTGHSAYSELWFKQASTGNQLSCGATPAFRVSRGHPSHEQIFKAVMAAYLAGKPLNVSYETVATICYIKRVTMADTL